MRKLTCLTLAASMLAFSPGAAEARTKLTVYACMEREQIQPMKLAIEAAVPGVEAVMVHDATGVIIARALAERARPQADLVLGCAVTSMLVLKEAGLLEGYKPANYDALKPQFRDDAVPPTWIGMYAYLGVGCFNKIEGQRANVPVPTKWTDLLAASFKNRLLMPHPASSGTGYMLVSFWIQLMGEEAAWKYMDRLHENIAQYTHSGSAPCVQAARGEHLFGLSLDVRAAALRTAGAPIDVVVPVEGTGWEMNTASAVKGRPAEQSAGAKRVLDWLSSQQANELYNKDFAVIALSGPAKMPPNYPSDAEARMLKNNDFVWAAASRDRILAEWSRRYERKASPKK